MNKPEPLPCAHCGGQPRIVSPDLGDNTYKIYCRACGSSLEAPTEQEAVAAWNRREESTALKERVARQAELVEALEAKFEQYDRMRVFGSSSIFNSVSTVGEVNLAHEIYAKAQRDYLECCERTETARARLAELKGKENV